jgi:hypothetical protein
VVLVAPVAVVPDPAPVDVVVAVLVVVLVVVVVPPDVLAKKLLVIVAVHDTLLAPAVPELLHWVIVVGRPVDCEAGAVVVQVSVPPAPPERLH